jgi:superfamily I DNA/RNA helicase
LIEQGFDPARVLAITFARKAVLEIQSRLKKRLNGNGDKALVCTFHSVGYRILKAENSLGAGCRLVHDTDQLSLMRYAMAKVKVEDDAALVMSKVSLAKNDLLSPADLESSSKHEDKKNEPERRLRDRQHLHHDMGHLSEKRLSQLIDHTTPGQSRS